MDVIKRDGRKEKASLDKVTRRAEALADGLKVEPIAVAQRVVSGLYDGIKVTEIDVFLAETAASLATEHPDYAKLAARVMVSSLQKETSGYATATRDLSEIGILSDTYVDFVAKNQFALEEMIDYKRDYQFDYFGYKTLERSYLLKVKGVMVERPQDMFMRVA
ncbi:ATP cone domain-containing protein, partial [Vibrio rotiferianus]